MTIDGVDYSYSRPSPAGLMSAGKTFVVRYGAVGNTGKHLTAAEVTVLKAAGLDIVANVEETAKAFRGTAAGVRHATAGDAFFRNLGMPASRPIYFSVDWDAGTADWPAVDAALRGAASVLGAGRVGVYGGYDTIAHCASAGTARWFWQTYAWSGGRWHPACHLQQYKNNVALAGGTVDLDRATVTDHGQWGAAMPMDPRTHPKGAPPDFTLPKPNPMPTRMTDALWWLVCMRLQLEPLSRNGGTLAIKPGYHSYGSRLPDYGQGDSRTDHSVRWSWDRTGPWWRDYCSAHDWTFEDAHTGDYKTISKYVNRLINAMRSPTDLRPDDVYAYTIGQADNDLQVEGYNERTDAAESGDDTHLWHRHDSFRRNIVGDYQAMWKALTIDMGWTYAEWQQSIQEADMALTEADVRTLANAKVWPAPPLTGATGSLSLLDLLTRLYNRAAETKALAGDTKSLAGDTKTLTGGVSGALAAYIEAEATDATAKSEALAKLHEAVEAIPVRLLDMLGDPGIPDEQIAASLTDLLGTRAATIGALLQSMSPPAPTGA